MTRLIFQLGTNNWQRDGEFAPGSGILHEAHHLSLNAMDDTKAFSMYPSRIQRRYEDDVRVFELEHDIPICESASPVSNHRWHSMTEPEVAAYRVRLVNEVDIWINAIERQHQEPVSLAIAHHTFLNPIVLADVNERRISRGRPRIPVLCFAHGTALNMFGAELSGRYPEEFPRRFLPMVDGEGVFDATGDRSVDWVAVTSTRHVRAFNDTFGDFPLDRVILSPNGYDQETFTPAIHPTKVQGWRESVIPTFVTRPFEGSAMRPVPVPGDYDNYVVFSGKFAEWKRLDALLEAASIWERNARRVATIVAGSGSAEDQRKYQELAYNRLGLRHTYFVGARGREELALLYSACDVACFPSRNEPFGQVFVEAMACGTPVIGANSGSPKDFINDDIGLLVLESEDNSVLGARLEQAVTQALQQDWKRTRGASAMHYARNNFSVRMQLDQLLAQLTREQQLV